MNNNMVVIVKALNAYNVSKSPNDFIELFNKVINTVKSRCKAFSQDDSIKMSFRQSYFSALDDFANYEYERVIVSKMVQLCNEAIGFYYANENVKNAFEDMRNQLNQISNYYETFDLEKNDWLIEALINKYAA